MAERQASPTQTDILEIPVTNSKENEHHWGVGIALALGAVAAVGALHGAGEAKAENELVFGGRYDVNSQEYTRHLIETRQIDPATDNIFSIENPAGMIKWLDGTSMRETTDISNANAQHVLDTQIDPSQKTNLRAYSLNTASALETARKNEDVVDSVILDKSPYGPGGISSSELAKDPEIKAMLDDNEIIIHEPLPTDIPVTFNSNPADVISGGGLLPPDIQAVIDSFMKTFEGPHDMSDPTQPHNVQKFGNVTVAWYGNNPLPAITFDPAAPAPELVPAPGVPAPEAAVLVNAVVPAPEAAPASEVLVQAAAPAPEAVRSATPSFFGEQPCIAPDGSQYFTPGDAPC